jgi:hypothetical protein
MTPGRGCVPKKPKSGCSIYLHHVRPSEISEVRHMVAGAVQQGAREKCLTHLAPSPFFAA